MTFKNTLNGLVAEHKVKEEARFRQLLPDIIKDIENICSSCAAYGQRSVMLPNGTQKYEFWPAESRYSDVVAALLDKHPDLTVSHSQKCDMAFITISW